ncbi:hypothetical protein DF281_13835 [Kurthia zopfii]|uniref:hypothetical protein n=1 Tax=Kurthia zopfii TaxID=1650 RepID=UPI000D6809ED|nr:hypothetical protein [Kurthia zopfii]PWI21116.1 hypothetical protein DF281_13835 [Kurthia zopfii]
MVGILVDQGTNKLNNDLWKQVTQMNDANLLGSLTYTTKAQQPFKIAYDYTKNGMLKMSQERNVHVARLIQLASSKQHKPI